MARKYVVVSLVLVAMSAFVIGCNDTTTDPVISNEAPLLAPTSVVATVTAQGIELSWDPNSSPNLRGYNVYRIDRSLGEMAHLNSNVVTDTRYTDTSAQWRSSYQYRVTTLSLSNRESGFAAVNVSYVSTRDKTRDDMEKDME